MIGRIAGRAAARLAAIVLAALSSALGHSSAAWAEEGPSTAPILRIETGSHGAAINALVAAPDDQIVTVSSDKTARIWSAGDGSSRGVLRPPIGDGPEGLLYAVALSPSGDNVAVAGHTGFAWDGTASIYFFDRKAARWRGRVQLPETDAITALAFSPVQKLIAVGANDGKGLRVVDLAASKINVADPGYGDAISGLAFAPDGSLATASLDGKVRLYGPDLVRKGEWQAPSKVQPASVAFDPKGGRLAVGFLNWPRAIVLAVPDMKLAAELDLPKGAQGAPRVVAWSPDGATLYGAGNYGDKTGTKLLRAWSVARKDGRDVSIAKDTVTSLVALADGRVAFASADATWGVLGSDLAPLVAEPRAQADFRDGYAAGFAISPDGRTVDFATDASGSRKFRFDLADRQLVADPQKRADMLVPSEAQGAVKVTDWRNGTAPKASGAKLELDPNERSRAVAVLPDGAVLMGTDYSLRLYRKGISAWRTALATEAWTVAAAPDAGIAVAALGDGTIRWYRLTDGVEVLSLFPHSDGTRWIAWTPEGFFDHGKGGEGLIGYHLNLVDQGRPRGAELVAVEQLYKLFFRPDLVVAKARGDSEKLIADQLAAIGDVRTVLGRGLPPNLKLTEYCLRGPAGDRCTSVDPGAVRGTGRKVEIVDADAPEAVLHFEVENRGGGIGPVVLRRNGATVPGHGGTRSITGTASSEERIVKLEPGVNLVSLSAFNAAAEIEAGKPERPAIAFRYQPPAAPQKPVLHVLAIGIDKFASPDVPTLKNAANDARGIVQAIKDGASDDVFSRIDATVLTDAEAGKAAIEQALAKLADQSGPDDTTLVFLAGHGVTLDGKYYYLPHDVPDLKTETIKSSAIGQDLLTQRLGSLPTWRTAMVLDTCFSGAFAVADSVARDARDQTVGRSISQASGRFILAGSASQEEALDGIDGHGVFTGVVLQGLLGAADQEVRGNKDGRVDVYELAEYVKAKVPEMAAKVGQGHRQSPRWYFSGDDMFTLRAAAR